MFFCDVLLQYVISFNASLNLNVLEFLTFCWIGEMPWKIFRIQNNQGVLFIWCWIRVKCNRHSVSDQRWSKLVGVGVDSGFFKNIKSSCNMLLHSDNCKKKCWLKFFLLLLCFYYFSEFFFCDWTTLVLGCISQK